ncbi:PREDICTED: putative uncharacterized protein DDB_G0271982, partial [Habropoda laboriosa]|uniref:putative uncharacterized protein DDB_G0271982 n=1 Tax=Habropoda laboriosa TaxID=597456 RepID=UPI00083CBDE9
MREGETKGGTERRIERRKGEKDRERENQRKREGEKDRERENQRKREKGKGRDK